MRIGDARSTWGPGTSGTAERNGPSAFFPAAAAPPAPVTGGMPRSELPTCQTEGYCSYCGRCGEIK